MSTIDLTRPYTWVASRLSRMLPGECLVCAHATAGALCSICDARYWPREVAMLRCACCGIRAASLNASFDVVPDADPDPETDKESSWRCGQCELSPPAFDATIALADYRPPLDVLAIAFKYQARPALGAGLAERLAAHAFGRSSRMPAAQSRPDYLIPVPASPYRLASRGYNQAWELARRVARHAALPAYATLIQRRHSAAQAGLSLASRQRNMRAALQVSAKHSAFVRGAHVGVVDDVMTTGATFDAVARTLKASGARRVTNLVLFRTA